MDITVEGAGMRWQDYMDQCVHNEETMINYMTFISEAAITGEDVGSEMVLAVSLSVEMWNAVMSVSGTMPMDVIRARVKEVYEGFMSVVGDFTSEELVKEENIAKAYERLSEKFPRT